MHRSSLTTPDGVPLAVYEAGDPAGPEILFIHGFSQSALSWQRQMTSAALARFRLIAWDLRGHTGCPRRMRARRAPLPTGEEDVRSLASDRSLCIPDDPLAGSIPVQADRLDRAGRIAGVVV